MNKLAIIEIIMLVLCVLAGVFLSGCDLETNGSSAKNKEIIELVSGSSWIHPNVFRDTETGQEYIVFRYDKVITVTPRLPKEDKECN